MLARLTIHMIDHDGIITVDPMALEVELPEGRIRIIDEVEEQIVRWREAATRTLTTTYLRGLSQKAQKAQTRLGAC